MSELKIQAVCGFGCGSSLFLRIKIEEILKENHVEARVFCGDVGTCCSADCDVIFISEDLSDRILERAKVPVVIIKKFTDKNEVAQKTMEYVN
ncbi:MAG: PTS sugar transporter subunit IIB, partial [Oscillospiraceae bacterium]